MATEDTPPLPKDKESVRTKYEDYTLKMRELCRPQIPFLFRTKMESTITVSSDCFDELRDCCEFCTDLAKVKLFQKQDNKTRAILVLSKYHSIERLRERIRNSLRVSESNLIAFENRITELNGFLETDTVECSKCGGNGIFSKWVHIRERGTPTQSILKTYPCEKCDGIGQITVFADVKKNLPVFLKNANNLLTILRDSRNYLTNFFSSSS